MSRSFQQILSGKNILSRIVDEPPWSVFVGFRYTCCAIPHPGFLPNSPGLSESFEMKEVSIFVFIGTPFAITG